MCQLKMQPAEKLAGEIKLVWKSTAIALSVHLISPLGFNALSLDTHTLHHFKD